MDGSQEPSHHIATLESAELRYMLRSIAEFAPWVRRIFVMVPGGEQPNFVPPNSRYIEVVTHAQVMPRKYLPTYNEHAVQCYLDRVPHLSEHFIFMNEGMFFGAALSPWDFFTNTGLPRINMNQNVLHGAHDTLSSFSSVHDWAVRNNNQLLDVFYKHPGRRPSPLHQPLPLTRHIFGKMQGTFHRSIEQTVRRTYASRRDIIPVYLALWTAIYENDAVEALKPPSYKIVVLTPRDMTINEGELSMLVKSRPQLFYLKDLVTDRAKSTQLRAMLLKVVYNTLLSRPAFWEVTPGAPSATNAAVPSPTSTDIPVSHVTHMKHMMQTKHVHHSAAPSAVYQASRHCGLSTSWLTLVSILLTQQLFL